MDAQQPGLGQKIARLRKAKGLTQEELVEKCHLNVRTLQRIEAGEVTPRSYTIRSIFNALGYSTEENSIEESSMEESSSDEKATTPAQEYALSPAPPRDKAVIRKISCYVLDLFNFKTNAMKKIAILSTATLIIFTVSFSACLSARRTATSENELVGTWQLYSYGKPDTTYDNKPGQVRYKLITPGHFMITDIEFRKEVMYAAFFGTLTLDPKTKTYSEKLQTTGGYGYARYMREEPFRFSYTLKDSFLYTTGLNNNYNEVWKKLR